ncbi:transcriptional regulator [Mycobacteroides abscessus]|uniref:LysR substrate-binding domain-containing protein n=2 Tax=Mycobacteriaceae TaxID=1762 RepID=UPI0002E64A72|nr:MULTISPECIES: LysR substrate-binding domain-containing protein [Mycobacteriaceae]MDX1880933.1 LysR substrate-binding domain-containing protein [Mycolicibacterium sp. 141076]RIT45886.1 LysR family transcriptional regulator [Mycobacteroides abscessus]UCZ59355.1 LysR family transcriptional regulator [Mycolicibacterium phocaicum]CPT65475.1 transcriptional regulator [Mycobacteroides abscessus]CPU59680.1 transcriptional regulator [Mycobacteroides abscessus]
MELRHLRYFRAVAEELHFGRAAQRLHIAQPPLSQQIRQLERELGVELLIRSTRHVALTPAGQAFHARAIAILDAVDDAADLARRVADGTTGRLTIGCVGSATYSVLPRLVRALGELLPDVDVRVRGEMLAPAQLAALAAGEIDLALLRPPVIDPGLCTEIIRRDSLLVALPEGHRLSKRKALAIGDLREEDLVAHAGGGRSVMALLLATLCADAGFTPRVRHEVEETSTLVTLVAAGLGAAIVPAPTSALDIAGVVYRPLQPKSLGVELVAAWPASPHDQLVRRVIEALRESAT